jgi:hypothetical protein
VLPRAGCPGRGLVGDAHEVGVPVSSHLGADSNVGDGQSAARGMLFGIMNENIPIDRRNMRFRHNFGPEVLTL